MQTGKPPAPLPPPVAAGAGKAKTKAVDMDWDDEEESTHVFDKQVHDAQLQAVVSGAPLKAKLPTVPPPPKKPVSSLPPPPAVPHPPSVQVAEVAKPAPARWAEPYRDDPTSVNARARATRQGGGRASVVLAAAALVAVAGIGFYVLMPKTGDLRIKLATQGGAPVDTALVYVNGAKKCDISPCTVSDLPAGPKEIKVVAASFQAANLTANVEPGKTKEVNVTLEAESGRSSGFAGLTTPGMTELKIAGTEGETSVRVLVDGVDKGSLPVDLRNLPVGPRKIQLDGGDRFEKLERSVELISGRVVDLGEIKLKVLRGQLTVELATPGASVSLLKGADRRSEKKLDALFKTPPVKLDIDTKDSWTLVATKKGFDDFHQEVSFEDGTPKKSVVVQLTESSKASAVTVVASRGQPSGNDRTNPSTAPERSTQASPEPGGGDEKPDKSTETKAASGQASLNINSIPPSKVLLDGAPQGSTPRVGISVAAGSHTVTFVHPDYGRKSVTVSVKAGETKTAAVKFEH
jgi:serine/threonine-protein kinase